MLSSLPILLLVYFPSVNGHGRLIDPPSRSSMWRYGFKNPRNYDDNALYCGGTHVQYDINAGKCGVCGDPWNGPRENEAGGKYANGIIVRKYEPGQVITVVVDLTANHKGWFEFRLCPNDNPRKPVTHDCLDQFVLPLAKSNKFRYSVPNQNGRSLIKVDLRLPENVRCRNCVFQWKYNAGNSWGVDSSGRGCLGCGNQEQFYGCADIAIGYDDIMIPPHNTLPADMEDDEDDRSSTLPPPPPIWHEHTQHPEHPPDIGERPEVSKMMEQFMNRMNRNRGSDSFKFLPIMETDGVHPCMCICKMSPVHLHGGIQESIKIKLFEGSEDKQVCMCMCQNSAKSLKTTNILYLIALLIVTIVFRLGR